MIFPVESEDRTTRNLLMLSQDHARLTVESFRKVLVMIENLVNHDVTELRDRLEEIEKIHSESIEIRRIMMKELYETGGMLINREEFYRLFSKLGEGNDHIKGVGVRLWEMGEQNWKVPKEIGDGLLKMAEIAFETLTKLRESLISLGFDSERAIVLIRQVDEVERRMDTIYREVDLEIITSKSDLPVILMLRDIADKIEKVVDKANELADLIRIIAL